MSLLLWQHPWSSSAQTHSALRPACDGSDPDVSWTRVGSSTGCAPGGTTVRKLHAWNGHIAENNAELRFRMTDRPFPEHYRLSVDVIAMYEPEVAAQAACAGFATHADATGATFESLSVCSPSGSGGKFSLITVRGGTEIARNEKPLPGGGPYTLTADVKARTVAFSVRSADGRSSSLRTTAVASTTSHVGLVVFWKSASASATFANFRYQPQ